MKMNWSNIYKESFSINKALEMILFTQGVTYLPLSHVAAQVLSNFKIKTWKFICLDDQYSRLDFKAMQ